jgi:hypothetical protein
MNVLRYLYYKILTLFARAHKQSDILHMKTVSGRILLIDKTINCLYVLLPNYELIRCIVPRFLKCFNYAKGNLIHITGFVSYTDQSGKILLIHKGCTFTLDSNRPKPEDSDIVIGKF